MFRIDVKVQWEKRSVELATLRTVAIDANGQPVAAGPPTAVPVSGESPTAIPRPVLPRR
jgi:hypothetical protein